MDNLWIWLALISAFTSGTHDALVKKALQDHDVMTVAWLRQFIVVILLLPCLLFISIPELKPKFFSALLLALPFEVLAYVLFLKAIKSAPLSLTVPFLSLTPVFLVFIPYFILGESISLAGGMGILMIALGGYALNIGEIRKGLLEPLRAIVREKGSVFMIAAAIMYGFSNTFAKQAIENSSAFFFGITYNLAFFVAVTPVVLIIGKPQLSGRINRQALYASLAPGMFAAITVFFYTLAMSLTNVAYMVAVSRLSLLVGVFYGHFIFKESGFKERVLGTMLMLAGFAIIALKSQ